MSAALDDATLLDHDDLVRHPPPPGVNEMPDGWRNGSVGAYGPMRYLHLWNQAGQVTVSVDGIVTDP